MKHKFDSYSITDIVGVLDKNENNELCIFVELKDNKNESCIATCFVCKS